MTNEFVSLNNLADELGLDRSNARKYVLKQGLHPHKRRTHSSHNQLVLALTTEEVTLIKNKLKEDGFFENYKPILKEVGVFYIIKLIPELDPKRIKLGYADDITSRLAQHRTAAPTAIVVNTWPCKRSWENTIIDCLACCCHLIMNEVFECSNIEALVEKANDLFLLLPVPGTELIISKHSPLKIK